MSGKILFAIIGAGLILSVLSGCRSTTFINAITPRGDFDLHKNIPYGADQRQTLDIYTPTKLPPKPAIIVFVHGGSWADGDKEQYLFVGQAFAEMGYVTVIPNYRLYPQVKFPDFIDDIAIAVARLPDLLNDLPQQTCAQNRKIILVGHSAGAHSVAMLATDPQYLQRNKISTADSDITTEDPRAIITTWIGLAGPYDLPLDSPMVVDKFNNVTNNVDANPLNLATSATLPALLIHGEDDDIVYPKHTRDFSKRLQELGVPVVTHYYPDTNHTKLVGGLAKRLRFLNPVYADIENYLAAMQLDEQCEQIK